MAQSKKMGRPPKAAEDVRGETLTLRLTMSERSALDTAASARGVEVSAWVRDLALKAAKRPVGSSK
jgi:uncharacterized protein (DUF1778 family)